MKHIATFTLTIIIIACLTGMTDKTNNTIKCSSDNCSGQYEGPEFINGSDIAHQFSNKMSAAVGDQLKKLFNSGDYVKVDFDNIEMTTKGMGIGSVIYYLKIPFIKVQSACDAYTSFDHVGGWNHSPELAARKKQLQKALMPGHSLDINELKRTPEGLQEHWIQWKNKKTQSMCE